MNESPIFDLETPESWEEARQVGGLIGEIPSSFSTVIRLLRADAEKGLNELSRSAGFGFSRLIKSDSFAAPLYFAAQVFYPDDSRVSKGLSRGSIGTVFRPSELSTLIALLYLYRRIKRGCDAQEWEQLEQMIHTQSTIGGLVGQALPAVGLAHGVMVGALRPLALAMFAGIDKSNFAQYRRELKRKNLFYDLNAEMSIWGCTHLQVASVLVQPFGFGVEYSQGLVKGLVPDTQPKEKYSKDVLSGKVTTLWIQSLITTEKAPNIAHRLEYYPDGETISTLIARTKQAMLDKTFSSWLKKTKDDISPDTTPTLFTAGQLRVAAPSAVEAGDETLAESLEKDLEEVEE